MAQKDKVKELVGRSLDSYHTKTLQQMDRIERKNKEQNHKINILTNELDNDYLTKTEEGSVISLDHSKEGMVYIDSLEGNTLVNYCTDGSKELTLNGDIDVEGTFVTTTEGVDNGLVDIMCEGNTLVNLCPSIKNGWYASGSGIDGTQTVKTETSIKLSKTKSGSAILACDDSLSLTQKNKTYTILFNLTKTINNDAFITSIRYNDGVYHRISGLQSLGLNKAVFSLREDKDIANARIVFGYTGSTDDIGEIEISNIMILEGDYTNKEIPKEYIEGMKSVGQDDTNGHKIEILSQNKNHLFLDDEHKTHNGSYQGVSFSINNDGHMVVNGTSTGDFATSDQYRFDFKNGKTYTLSAKKISGESSVGLSYFISYTDETNTQKWVQQVTWKKEYKNPKFYTQINYKGSVFTNAIYSFQVEEGSSSTDFVKPKLNKKEILLNEPLRGLPNGVRDRFVKIGGKWFIERNCGEYILTETSNITPYRTEVEGKMRYKVLQDDSVLNLSSDRIVAVISDKLKSITALDTWKCTSEGIAQNSSSNSLFVYLEEFSDGTEISTSNLKNRLLNTKVQFQLSTPIYEPLEIEPTLSCYNDITHISNNSIIPCNMKVKNTGYNAIIKPSTLYTVALDTNKNGTIGMNLGGVKGTTTNNVLTLTTPSILADDSLRLFGKGIKGSKVRLLEGDKTNWIPSHFEGMKSSFEDKLQDDNTYKMEILSNNKNLFNINEKDHYGNTSNVQINGNTIIATPTANTNEWSSYSFKVKGLEHGKTYILSCDAKDYTLPKAGISLYEKNRNKHIGSWGTPFVVEKGVDLNNIYLRIHCCYGNLSELQTVTLSDVIIERASVSTEYEDYFYNKIQFSSLEPLRKWDRFVFKDGQLMIERGSGFKNLNDMNWGNTEDKERCFKFGSFGTTDFKYRAGSNLYIYSNTLATSFLENKIPCVCCYGHSENKTELRISIDKKELNSLNVDGLKEWLKKHPTNIIYQLAEPTYEEVPHELAKIILEGYENGTLFIDTIIPPTVTTTYAGETPIVKATKLNKTEVSSNTQDINDNIVPYLMDMDYRVVCLQLATEELEGGVSMAKLFGGVYEMLKRDILSKRLTRQEYGYRLADYFNAGKLTEEQVRELEDLR